MQVHSNTPLSVKDIDASLQHGKVVNSKIWSGFCIAMWVLSGIMFLISILGCIFDPADKDWLFALFGGLGTAAAYCLLFLLLGWGKRKVKKYLPDAVILKAVTKKADSDIRFNFYRIFLAVRSTAILVRFSYMKKKFVKNSLLSKKGAKYSTAFNKFVDKELLIAYSPKYDQVMFIKPKSEQRIWAEHNNGSCNGDLKSGSKA